MMPLPEETQGECTKFQVAGRPPTWELANPEEVRRKPSTVASLLGTARSSDMLAGYVSPASGLTFLNQPLRMNDYRSTGFS